MLRLLIQIEFLVNELVLAFLVAADQEAVLVEPNVLDLRLSHLP